jgi:translation initiation factor IF-2
MIELPSSLTVGELADKLGQSPIQIIKALMRNGIMATMNQALDFDTAGIVAADLGIEVFEEGKQFEPEPVVVEPEPDYSTHPGEDAELALESEPAVIPELEVEEEPTITVRSRRRRRGPGQRDEDEDEAFEIQPIPGLDDGIFDDPDESLVKRPPVVTIMGHVDHGKTLMLDTIRSTNVVAGEAGGITQHIGAYQIKRSGEKITFLDTPGHAAFTAMRARGAKVTDITIIVIAASEGVMPQTLEAIDHAKAAGVPIIVAMNKMDLPDANPDRVKAQLAETGLALVEWGGDVEVVNVSAKTGAGIDDLLALIIYQAEVANDTKGLRANPNTEASGTVIEARMDRQRGPLATLIVQRGTLKIGDYVVAGGAVGKARALTNDLGQPVKEAPPSMPVTILGLGDVPAAGDRFKVFGTEKEARAAAEAKALLIQQGAWRGTRRGAVVVTDILAQMERGKAKDLNLVIKGDVQGSVEAISSVLQDIDRNHAENSDGSGMRVKILRSAVGAISEDDINLANASDAMVIGFGVGPDPGARRASRAADVEIREYNIIYKLTEDIEAMLAGSVDPVYGEVIYGHAEVRQIFTAGRTTIAGSYVTDGRFTRSSTIRLSRGGEVIWTGGMTSLRRFKEDVREVQNGFEFGITLDGNNDVQEGDILESFGQERTA